MIDHKNQHVPIDGGPATVVEVVRLPWWWRARLGRWLATHVSWFGRRWRRHMDAAVERGLLHTYDAAKEVLRAEAVLWLEDGGRGSSVRLDELRIAAIVVANARHELERARARKGR